MRRNDMGNAVVKRAITLAMAFMIGLSTFVGSAFTVKAEEATEVETEITTLEESFVGEETSVAEAIAEVAVPSDVEKAVSATMTGEAVVDEIKSEIENQAGDEAVAAGDKIISDAVAAAGTDLGDFNTESGKVNLNANYDENLTITSFNDITAIKDVIAEANKEIDNGGFTDKESADAAVKKLAEAKATAQTTVTNAEKNLEAAQAELVAAEQALKTAQEDAQAKYDEALAHYKAAEDAYKEASVAVTNASAALDVAKEFVNAYVQAGRDSSEAVAVSKQNIADYMDEMAQKYDLANDDNAGDSIANDMLYDYQENMKDYESRLQESLVATENMISIITYFESDPDKKSDRYGKLEGLNFSPDEMGEAINKIAENPGKALEILTILQNGSSKDQEDAVVDLFKLVGYDELLNQDVLNEFLYDYNYYVEVINNGNADSTSTTLFKDFTKFMETVIADNNIQLDDNDSVCTERRTMRAYYVVTWLDLLRTKANAAAVVYNAVDAVRQSNLKNLAAITDTTFTDNYVTQESEVKKAQNLICEHLFVTMYDMSLKYDIPLDTTVKTLLSKAQDATNSAYAEMQAKKEAFETTIKEGESVSSKSYKDALSKYQKALETYNTLVDQKNELKKQLDALKDTSINTKIKSKSNGGGSNGGTTGGETGGTTGGSTTPTTPTTPAATPAATPARRTANAAAVVANDNNADANTEVIPDAETPLAGDEIQEEQVEEPAAEEIVAIEDEEVSKAGEVSKFRSWWWIILLIIAAVTATYTTIKVQKNKKKAEEK